METINIVFGGSGTNYPAYIGAYKALYEALIATGKCEIGELAGTSGGAIIAALIACGYDRPEELERVVTEILPKDIIDWSWNPFYRWGLIKGKKFRKKLSSMLREDLPGSSLKYPLKIVVTNVDKEQGEVIDCLTTDMPLSSVVYASACFPIVFSPVVIKGEKYIDGGLSNNLPVNVVDDNNQNTTYAFRIKQEDIPPKKVKNVKEYLFRMLNILLKELTRAHLEDLQPFTKIYSAVGHPNGMNLWLTEEDVHDMIEKNYQQFSTFF